MKHSAKSCDLKLLLHLFQDEARKIVFYDNQYPLDDKCPMDFVQYGDLQALEQYIHLNAVPISIINISKTDISHLYKKKEVRCIIDFQNQINKPTKSFDYINNPSGGIRWLFPSDSTYPTFLSLYNGSGIKAKIYRLVCQFAFFFGIKKPIISGTFSVLSKAPFLDKILAKSLYSNYAIFTGTVGPNRKMVLASSYEKEVNYFIKIPLTKKSKQLVQQEYEQLKRVKGLDFKTFDFPEVTQKNDCVKLTNVANKQSRNSTDFGLTHSKALKEIYEKTILSKPLLTLHFWTDILDNLQYIGEHRAKSLLDYPQLYDALPQLFEQIESSTRIQTALAHGDFTPWNMYLAEDRLQIYDWELAQEGFPLLYDCFHYIFQSNILIKRQGYQNIKNEILDAPVQQIINKYELDTDKYLKLYLLHVVTYYVKLYMDQEHLHEQAHWLLKTWEDALLDLTKSTSKSLTQNS